jgi:hypothetical protein
VGEGDYIVQPGDCISSIAQENGHFWQTIWNDPHNSALKSARGDPNVLLEGDRVTIPPIRIKYENRQTGAEHRFVRVGTPAKLRICIMEDPEPPQEQDGPAPIYEGRDVATEDPASTPASTANRPRANAPYVLTIDGRSVTGNTDANGYLEVCISPAAREGRLVIDPGTLQEREYTLRLGHLDPLTEIAGVKQRLANLSFECGDRSDEATEGFRAALMAFQEASGLPATGELTSEVRDKIRELHGS